MVKTVILCGGKGTRIRGVSDRLPKPMLPIGEYPILWHIMRNYAKHNFKDFVLCLGYLGWEIKNYFLNYQNKTHDFSINFRLDEKNKVEYLNNSNGSISIDWNIIFAETGHETMTGGRIAKIKKYVQDDEYFMLTYGDGLSNVDAVKLIEFHKSHGKIATVTGVRPAGRFGEIEINSRQQVTEFNEKPQTSGGRINGGFMVLDSKRIWKYIHNDSSIIFEQEPMRNLAKDGELMMYIHEGFWQPMDTFREFQMLNEMWESGIKNNDVAWD